MTDAHTQGHGHARLGHPPPADHRRTHSQHTVVKNMEGTFYSFQKILNFILLFFEHISLDLHNRKYA